MKDPLVDAAKELNAGWRQYVWLFGGEPPHGTEKQLVALLELCPKLKALIRASNTLTPKPAKAGKGRR